MARCLFRVTREALTNAVRHAHAGSIAVQLTAAGEHAELRITDDGVGFVIGERAGTGLGLRSTDERVRLIGGDPTPERPWSSESRSRLRSLNASARLERTKRDAQRHQYEKRTSET